MAGGCDALYRFFIEQTLKLAYIVTGEQLFLKVPYLETFVKFSS